VDSVIGSVLDDFPYTLVPGATAFLTQYHTPSQTTVYTGTWTARDPVGMLSASDTDSAFLLVPAPGPAASGLAALASLAFVAGRRCALG
jgi:hypothetical protein